MKMTVWNGIISGRGHFLWKTRAADHDEAIGQEEQGQPEEGGGMREEGGSRNVGWGMWDVRIPNV